MADDKKPMNDDKQSSTDEPKKQSIWERIDNGEITDDDVDAPKVETKETTSDDENTDDKNSASDKVTLKDRWTMLTGKQKAGIGIGGAVVVLGLGFMLTNAFSSDDVDMAGRQEETYVENPAAELEEPETPAQNAQEATETAETDEPSNTPDEPETKPKGENSDADVAQAEETLTEVFNDMFAFISSPDNFMNPDTSVASGTKQFPEQYAGNLNNRFEDVSTVGFDFFGQLNKSTPEGQNFFGNPSDADVDGDDPSENVQNYTPRFGETYRMTDLVVQPLEAKDTYAVQVTYDTDDFTGFTDYFQIIMSDDQQKVQSTTLLDKGRFEELR